MVKILSLDHAAGGCRTSSAPPQQLPGASWDLRPQGLGSRLPMSRRYQDDKGELDSDSSVSKSKTSFTCTAAAGSLGRSHQGAV